MSHGFASRALAGTPLPHATTHQSGGSDAIKLDDLAAPDDNTDLNASTSAHGLLKKLDNTATNFLDGTGAWDSVKDSDLSTSDITTNDASTSKHGFLKKLSNISTEFMNGVGNWATPAASVGNIIYLREEQTSGTDGGTFTSGAWRTRVLNTEVLDTGSNCSLSSNAFTLDAGTYEIMAWGVGYAVSRHQMRLQNTSDATTTITGANRYSFGGYEGGVATVVGRFTIASSKTFELQHKGETTSATYGFGVACSFGTEVYAEVWLRKVA